ncbi:MAG: hypothetical protein JOZ44_05740 [Acidobacteria bacterium]|nr:hypothetical protein [Acidobacteriota bacterium]
MPAVAALLLFANACGNKQNASNNEPAPAATSSPGQAGQTASAGQTPNSSAASGPELKQRAATQPGPTTIPANTVITVRTGQALSSKTSQPGETFTATVAQPVDVGGAVVIPDGAKATGTVVTAHPLGRFKGGAMLQVKLTSVEINGQNVPVDSSSVARTEKGKGKRSATLIGGGAGLGAIIGGVAGGGKGALIGALAGGGAGTAGTAFTGNKDIQIPAEYALSFKLLKPVEVRK